MASKQLIAQLRRAKKLIEDTTAKVNGRHMRTSQEFFELTEALSGSAADLYDAALDLDVEYWDH